MFAGCIVCFDLGGERRVGQLSLSVAMLFELARDDEMGSADDVLKTFATVDKPDRPTNVLLCSSLSVASGIRR